MTSSFSITARLTFVISPPHDIPAFQHINAVISPDGIGDQVRNFEREEKEVIIENLRAQEDLATLDDTGFQLVHCPAQHTSFVDDAEIMREYYPESAELIKKMTGANEIVVFDHTIRRHRPGEIDDGPQKRQPFVQAHIDQTTSAAIERVRRHLPPAHAAIRLRGRFQIINLWRPINHPAIDRPLALCDYGSVNPQKDTLPIALVYPDREGEIYGVQYNPNQRWKYFHGVTPEEAILFKCFDSIQDGSIAVYSPHTAFQDPTTPEGTPLRESIELRALVFYA